MFFRKLISLAYLFYFKNFPLQRGKVWMAKLLYAMFGNLLLTHKNKITLSIVPYSPSELKFFINEGIDHIQKEIQELKPGAIGAIFFDIGSNIGYYSLLAANHLGNNGMVLAFDASPREYVKLLENIRINNAQTIVPFNIALGNENKICEFFLKKYHTGGNSLIPNSDNFLIKVNVPQLTLDLIIENLNILQIDLIKIDVEGAEMLVLKGMENAIRAKKVKKIIIEINEKFLTVFGFTANVLYDFLAKHGFKPQYNIIQIDSPHDQLFILE